MQQSSGSESTASHFTDRRTRPRFDMSLPVLLHTIGDPWKASKSKNISVGGAFVVTDSPFLPDAGVEYVLRLPPELTKANRPLMIRFFGTVVRSEHLREHDFSFGIALQSRNRGYLPAEEAAEFDALFEKLCRSGK